MAFSGEAVLIANSNRYGQNEGAPRGCAGDDTHVYVVGNNRKRIIRVTNLETFASEYASAAITGTIQSLAFLGGNAYFSVGTALHRINAPLTGSSTHSALTGTLPSNVFSLASDGTYLYGYRNNDRTIHRITISGQSLTAASFATVTFPAGVSTNIRAFFYHDGAFYFVNLSNNRLYKSPENVASGSTVAATRVGNFNNFGASVQGVHGAGVLGTEAYLASGSSDNLYRLYNVRWDETIDAIEVDEGANASLDLSGVSKDATSFEFAPSHTARSWLTISGTTLTITNAPAVAADTDFQAVVRAVRSSVNEEKTLTITVRDTTPKVPSAPRNVSATDTGSNFIELGWDAPADDGRAAIQDYEVRHAEGQTAGGTWASIGSATRSVRISSLKKVTQYTFQVRAVNSVGAGPASTAITVRTDATVPSAPRNLRITGIGGRFIDLEWAAPTDNGGAAIEGYAVNVAEGATPGTTWVATGSANTTHRITGLKPKTQYTLQVRVVNSVGAGPASASVTGITDVEPARPVPTQPSAPGQVEIEMTPTTADMSWKAPTNGAVIDEYEVNAEEGSTPGTTWIPTGSTQTRTMLKGLKRSTAYTFQVRARNVQGVGLKSTAMTQMTPIASLHNALFFKECVNYLDNGERVSVHGDPTDIVRAAADNDYNTFTREKDLAINIAVNGNPTRVDAVCVKCKGVTRHSGTPSGGSGTGWTNEALPAMVKNWEGTDISTTVLGLQHHLFLLDQHFTATSVRLQFEGMNVEIYEIMLLEFLFEIDANGDFTDISPDYVDRSAVIHTSPDGGVRRSSPLGGERHKWETDYVVKIIPGKTQLESVDEFVTQMGENPNVVHAQEPSRYPARIHPASFLLTRVLTRLRDDNKLLGDLIRFQVGEQ